MSAVYYSITAHMVLYLNEMTGVHGGPINFETAHQRILDRNPGMRETMRTGNTTRKALAARSMIDAEGNVTKYGKMTAVFLLTAHKVEGKPVDIQESLREDLPPCL